MGNRIEVKPGEKHNMLTFVRYAGYKKNDTEIWECKCDCGNTAFIKKTFVTSGHTKSCGCLKKIAYNTRHGKCETRLYNIHQKMKQRCYKEYEKEYKNYGGRGIQICDEWLGKDGFVNFYNWAMQNGYRDDLTIDRIDVNGNYEPDNCRWVDRLSQQNNKRNNRFLTINGETHTMAEWGRITGISEDTIERRINLLKWDVERALTQKVRKKGAS